MQNIKTLEEIENELLNQATASSASSSKQMANNSNQTQQPQISKLINNSGNDLNLFYPPFSN